MKKDTLKKVAEKKVKKGARKDEGAVNQELADELMAYKLAHNRLIRKLTESGEEPLLILATLHALHTASMKYEQEVVFDFVRGKESNGGK